MSTPPATSDSFLSCPPAQTVAEASSILPGCPDALRATKVGSAICAAPFVSDRADTFLPPSTAEQTQFSETFEALLRDPASGSTALAAQGFRAQVVNEEGTEYTLILDASCTSGRGTFVLRQPYRWNVIVEAPHIGFEHETLAEGFALLRLGARGLFIAGSQRCSSKTATQCRRGKGLPCGDGGPVEYRRSDVAADADNFFQAAHVASTHLAPRPVAISLHGKRAADTEPSVMVSDGTKAEAPEASLSRRLAEQLARAGVSARSCQEPGQSLRLCGTVSVQGRASNGSTDVCNDASTAASGTFLHVEQDYDKIGVIAPALQAALENLLPVAE